MSASVSVVKDDQGVVNLWSGVMMVTVRSMFLFAKRRGKKDFATFAIEDAEGGLNVFTMVKQQDQASLTEEILLFGAVSDRPSGGFRTCKTVVRSPIAEEPFTEFEFLRGGAEPWHPQPYRFAPGYILRQNCTYEPGLMSSDGRIVEPLGSLFEDGHAFGRGEIGEFDIRASAPPVQCRRVGRHQESLLELSHGSPLFVRGFWDSWVYHSIALHSEEDGSLSKVVTPETGMYFGEVQSLLPRATFSRRAA